MYVVVVSIQVKPEHREQWIEATFGDARGSVANERGCLRFDVIQHNQDPNKFYFYEVYVDEAAFNTHLTMPHFITWRDTVEDWYAAPNVVGKGHNLFPSDADWSKTK